ncbi:MAG: hypothetical protein Q9210_004068 [Variospora velana]
MLVSSGVGYVVALCTIFTKLMVAHPYAFTTGDTSPSTGLVRINSLGISDRDGYVAEPLINILNRLSSTTNLLGDSHYHVPNTDTTLYIRRSVGPVSIPYTALRNIISSCLVEVESIIDIAHDGIIPGPRHEYRKEIYTKDGSKLEIVQMMVKSTQRFGPPENLMTYGILHDALRGLWEFLDVARRESKVGGFRIENGEKGDVGLGYFEWTVEGA